jgi:DNA-directed RNA polymerase subunit RPC12/RpoP
VKRKPGEDKSKFAHKLFMYRTLNIWRGQKEKASKMGMEFLLTVEQVRQEVKEKLGGLCPYCSDRITLKTFSLDHVEPVSSGGIFAMSNIQVVCQPCNERKGKIAAKRYKQLVEILAGWPTDERQDVLRRLRMGAKAMMSIFWKGKGRPAIGTEKKPDLPATEPTANVVYQDNLF